MQLHDAIRAALPHVSTDNTLFLLTHVHIEDGHVWATDRYTLAHIDATEDDATSTPHDMLVPAATAKAILAAKSPIVGISANERGTEYTLALRNGQSFAVPATSAVGDYPNVARLFPDTDGDLPAPNVQRIALNQTYLEKFGAKHFPHKSARDRKHHVSHFTFGASDTKPVLVTAPEFPTFRGLIVPIRTKDAQ